MVKAYGRFGPEEGQRAQSKRRISAWAVLAAALLVALGAALVIAKLCASMPIMIAKPCSSSRISKRKRTC